MHYVRVQRSRGVSKGYKSGVKGYLGPVLQRSSAEEPRAQAQGTGRWTCSHGHVWQICNQTAKAAAGAEGNRCSQPQLPLPVPALTDRGQLSSKTTLRILSFDTQELLVVTWVYSGSPVLCIYSVLERGPASTGAQLGKSYLGGAGGA